MDTLVEDPYHGLFAADFPLREFLKWKDRTSFEEFERGEISEAEFFARYYVPGIPADVAARLPNPRKLKKRMFRSIRPLPGMPELLTDLSNDPKVQIGVASNYGEWYRQVLALRPEIERVAAFLFFSCELGARKPDARYFQIIEQSLSKQQASGESLRLFFVDDRKDNVQAAIACGWNGLQFSSAEQTRDWLKEHL